MKKISTLYKKNPENLSRVINEINPENEWVFTDAGVRATRKYDGTAAAIINGVLHKRYDVKKGKSVPEGAIPCQEPDLITGHWPHWVKVNPENKEDKYFMEGWSNLISFEALTAEPFNPHYYDGTYELCGEKVQGNPEKIKGHQLIKHGSVGVEINFKLGYEVLKSFLSRADPEDCGFIQFNIEGIVFHHPDGRMCKLRKSDFGIKR
jgi:hypothetical protein